MALNNCDVKVTQKQFNDAFEENCCHNQKFSIAAFERFDESKVKSEFKFLYYDCDENNDYPAYDCFQHQENFPLSYDEVTAMVAELFPSRVRQIKTGRNCNEDSSEA